jgi:caa(3)-type oxidase subunit IV
MDINSSPEAIRQGTRKALVVFGVLIVLTVLTVAISRVHLGALNMPVGLAIAAIKASLVGAYFMHLISEKQLIFSVLILAAVFFLVMMGLPLWTDADPITIN